MKICPTCQLEYPAEVDFCAADGMKLRAKRGATDDPLIGRALDGRWIIEEKLGEGGMGAVYRGHQRSVNRTVAIKTLRPQLVESDEFVNRFFREAQIAANIAHPHCVTILDYGDADDGTLYLAMEFLEGELLSDRIEAGTLTTRQIVEIGVQVASALSAAHDQNIVHRDLKPDNIFLIDVPGGATFVKVLDFGIAKMLDSNTQVTKTGMIFGTPEYMSPEQCRGDKIDGRSDLYSLGCILYELVGGRTPFRSTTPMAVLMAHVNQQAPALSEPDAGGNIPRSLEQTIMRLLAKDPDRRFESAAALRQALELELSGGSRAGGEAAGPAPARIVAPEVNIGFDQTMGIADASTSNEPLRVPTAAVASPPEPPMRSHRFPVMLSIVGAITVLAMVAAGATAAYLWADKAMPEEAAAVEPPEPAPVAELPPPAPVVEPTPEVVVPAETESAVAEVEQREAEETPTERPKQKRKRAPKVDREEPEDKEVVAEDEVEEPAAPAVEAEEPRPRPTKPKRKRQKKVDKALGKLKKTIDSEARGVSKSLEDKLDDLIEE